MKKQKQQLKQMAFTVDEPKLDSNECDIFNESAALAEIKHLDLNVDFLYAKSKNKELTAIEFLNQKWGDLQ